MIRGSMKIISAKEGKSDTTVVFDVLWQDGTKTQKQLITYKKSDSPIKIRAMIEKATTKG